MGEQDNNGQAQENEKTAKIAGAGAGVLAGAQIGTVLVPIPVVGTFTGGLVGGLIGSKIGKKVGGVLLDKMNSCTQPDSSRPQNQAGKTDVAHEIERLSHLKEQGLLSEEEFKAAKAKLLGL